MRYRLYIILLLLLPTTAFTVPVDGLYSARVPVLGQDATSRNAGIKVALRRVLIKLTGNKDILGQPALAALINNAQRYVVQYQYQHATIAHPNEIGLSVLFDERALARALREQGVPLWGRERPLVLLWLATKDEKKRTIIGRNTAPEHLDTIDQYAHSRGITVIHPLLDLTDAAAITASDIWAGFGAPIQAASRRYPANVILSGYIQSATPSHWRIRWTAFIKGQSSSWHTQDAVVANALEEGVDVLINKLRSYYNTTPLAQTTALPFTVDKVTTLAQYAKVIDYLSALNRVERIFVSGIAGDTVQLEVMSTAAAAALTEAISLGAVLRPAATGDRLAFELIEQ